MIIPNSLPDRNVDQDLKLRIKPIENMDGSQKGQILSLCTKAS